MFEVIPNWHPLFVHFSIALLSMSTVFFIMLKVTKNSFYQEQLTTLAYWNLWLGTSFAVVTAIAGWFAYNSVAHDTPSHEAMTDHRNWALITLFVFVSISLWSINQYRRMKESSNTFTFIIVMAFVLLVSTGWRGSELVYRYGLGVMSIPKAESDGHTHEHTTIDHHMDESNLDNAAGHEKADVTKKDDHSNHSHTH